MAIRLVVRLVILSFFLANCSFPGFESTPADKTPTSKVIPELPTSTFHPENTLEAYATDTPVLINTPSPTETPVLPTDPTPTLVPDVWYIIQPGTPLATYNTPHAAAGCSWLGVGGQVFGADSVPVLGLSILVGGTLDGYRVGSLGNTGMETNIGEGGYEITLADYPVDSSGTLWIQIVDSIGKPLSEKVAFDTVNDCERNFILINFIQFVSSLPSGSSWTAYLPLITNQTSLLPTPTP